MWAYSEAFGASLCFPVECPDVYIVERLFSSSLVVVVSLSMPRRMNVYHFKKGTEICNYSYSNNILSVRLNRQVRKRKGSVFTCSPQSCCFWFVLSWSLCHRRSGWWCAWRSRSTSTISKTWNYSRPCSTHPPTPQVHPSCYADIQCMCRPYRKCAKWFL